MSEACMHTQQLISLAYDGDTVTPEELRTAKAHCAECAECAAYVSGLARLRDVPAPTAPQAVVDAALSATRIARMGDLERATIAAAREAREQTDEPADGDIPTRAKARWAPWTGWAAAAAAIFLVVGIVTWQGVRYMLAPAGQMLTVSTESGNGEVGTTAPQEDAVQATGGATSESADTTYRLSAAAAPPYVVFDGWVYEVAEKSERIPADAEVAGTLTSDLGSGTPSQREVYDTDEATEILIAESDRAGRTATLVTREYGGVLYGLQSPDITVFGTWPSLPSSYPQPSSDDGSPEYDDAGEDASGETVYAQQGADPAAGFLIAPDTSANDPAAGNPNWTWWSPLR